MLRPSKVVRRQWKEPPSVVIAASDDHPPWYRDAGIRKMMFPLALIYLTQVCTGFDATLTANLQSFKEWKQVFIYSGRKLGLIFGQLLTVAGAGFQAGSHGRGQYMGSRFILGFGIAFITCAGPALLSELAHPRFRGTLVSFFNPFWYLGSIIVAWACFGTSHMDPTDTWNWRIPSCLQALCPIVVLLCAYWIPESPRWLMYKNCKEEAASIVSKYHGNGNPDDPLVATQLEEIEIAILRAQEGITWKALFAQKANLQRLLIVISMTLMTLWCGQNIITYYFSSILTSVNITGTTQQTAINGGLSITNLISSCVGALLVDRLGRRKLWMTSYAGMIVIFVPFITLSAMYAQHGRPGEGYGVVVCLFLFDVMYNVACNPLLYSYVTEVMPFYMRSRGLAVKNLVGQLALIANMYVNPIALEATGYHYYIFFLGLNCIWLAVIWLFFVETKGYTLEEIQRFFDGSQGSETVVLESRESMEKQGMESNTKSYKA
ncbi:hypothetical protein KJ359_009010 [Pestalotiopsis sp. 9143b]|nr:hypothetical protein KJ359_009010 [Pestalotiopsis sp. 9143b]